MMMKKLLVLTLVLGLTSMASATVSLSVPGTEVAAGDTMTISVVSDAAGDSYGGWLDLSLSTAGTWGDLLILPAAGADASKVSWDDNWWQFGAASFNPDAPVLAGTHFTVDFTGVNAGETVTFVLWNNELNQSEEATVTVTPEPMTLGLLGLGGLFLRRRR
jgi:MYXO-CTERM domain-containing protein